MSKMSDLIIDIQDEVNKGELSFTEIAAKFEVPVSWVDQAALMLQEYDTEENA